MSSRGSIRCLFPEPCLKSSQTLGDKLALTERSSWSHRPKVLLLSQPVCSMHRTGRQHRLTVLTDCTSTFPPKLYCGQARARQMQTCTVGMNFQEWAITDQKYSARVIEIATGRILWLLPIQAGLKLPNLSTRAFKVCFRPRFESSKERYPPRWESVFLHFNFHIYPARTSHDCSR